MKEKYLLAGKCPNQTVDGKLLFDEVQNIKFNTTVLQGTFRSTI